jgi:DNA-binding response OmpR family regulator
MANNDKKVLVVEDDDMLRGIIVNQLSAHFLAVPVKDGEEAWATIEKDKPDVIILDLLLPKMNGFDVLSKLRSAADPKIAQTPVLVVSNLSDEESIRKTTELKVLEHYTKSDISLGVLVNRIKRIFNT